MRFVKPVFIIILLIGFNFSFAGKTLALGGYLTGDYGQVAPVEVKAIIDYDGKTERIISSQTFTFNPLVVNNFYWVFALPENIELKNLDSKKYLKSDPFLELEKKTEKKFSKENILQKILYPDIAEEKFEASQTFSREAYIKFFKEAPKFKNMNELEGWFEKNAYSIPKNSRYLFSEYLKKNLKFFLAIVDGTHLEFDAKDSLTINGAHTLPIEAKFATEKIFYPLKLLKMQPDRDSVVAPLSFSYGSSSEDVLGIKDSQIDNLLSSPSSNFYPPLLLDLMTLKIDLFVRTNHKVEAKGFTTVYASRDEGKYLTRLIAYKPITQLEDITIERAKNNTRVNPQVTLLEKIIRIFVIVVALFFVFRRRRSTLH